MQWQHFPHSQHVLRTLLCFFYSIFLGQSTCTHLFSPIFMYMISIYTFSSTIRTLDVKNHRTILSFNICAAVQWNYASGPIIRYSCQNYSTSKQIFFFLKSPLHQNRNAALSTHLPTPIFWPRLFSHCPHRTNSQGASFTNAVIDFGKVGIVLIDF